MADPGKNTTSEGAVCVCVAVMPVPPPRPSPGPHLGLVVQARGEDGAARRRRLRPARHHLVELRPQRPHSKRQRQVWRQCDGAIGPFGLRLVLEACGARHVLRTRRGVGRWQRLRNIGAVALRHTFKARGWRLRR
eukprot:scaffold10253_cov124-Isochrysis_galbana.AAC.32